MTSFLGNLCFPGEVTVHLGRTGDAGQGGQEVDPGGEAGLEEEGAQVKIIQSRKNILSLSVVT